MLSRRTFLRNSPLVALAPAVPAFLYQSVRAAKAERDSRILVALQLDGGNDGINTLVPFADEAYVANRNELKLPRERLIKINDQVGLHPAMRAVGELLDDGRLAMVQAVGYPNPNRSHFRSMAIWHTARLDERQHNDYGWVGRALDGAQRSHGTDAIFVGPEKLPFALRGRRTVASSMLHNEDLSLASPLAPASLVGGDTEIGNLTGFVHRTVLDAYTTAEELSKATRAERSSTRYPETELAARLQLIAKLIQSGLSARVYYAIQSGYDTHAVQLPTHARLLGEFSGALKAFLDDLAAAGLADRVVVMAFSEFGRRVKENSSLGTDHGTAGPVLLAGPSIKAGLVGSSPNLSDLQDGDVKMQFDFRQLYASLLEDWLSLDSGRALGHEFEKLRLFT